MINADRVSVIGQMSGAIIGLLQIPYRYKFIDELNLKRPPNLGGLFL